MKPKNHISTVLMTLLIIGSGTLPLQGQTQLWLSASNCTPRSADEFDETSSGPDGFRWDDKGAMINLDNDETQDLICAVPYDPGSLRPDGTTRPVEIRVDVQDGHTAKEVRMDVFGQNGNVTVGTQLATAATTASYIGPWSLTVTINPSTRLRYLWIRVRIPDSEGSRTSGVVGYSVRRT